MFNQWTAKRIQTKWGRRTAYYKQIGKNEWLCVEPSSAKSFLVSYSIFENDKIVARPMQGEFYNPNYAKRQADKWVESGDHLTPNEHSPQVINQRQFQEAFFKIWMSAWQTRFGNNPTILGETLSHHQWNVAGVMIFLFYPLTTNEIYTALFHDIAEGLLGDMNTYAKDDYPEMAAEYEKVEVQLRREWGVNMECLTPKEHARFKAADRICASMHLILSGRGEEEKEAWFAEGGTRDRVLKPFSDAEVVRITPFINKLREMAHNGRRI